MRNVSNAYKKAMENRRDFYVEAEITFVDGVKKTIKKEDLFLSGNAYTESAGSTSFPLGILVSRSITLSLVNDDDRWEPYDFYGAKIFLRTKFDLDDGTTKSSINIGTFTVITPETYGETVEITAMDDSYKTDKEYSTSMAFPATLGMAFRDSCATCGISFLSSSFANDNYVIQTAPENLTHRQFLGYCAMLAGGNAIFNSQNRLAIRTYDFSGFENDGLDGGFFDDGITRYQSGDSADGGTFSPWNDGSAFDGGDYTDLKNIHVIYDFKSGMVIGVDDVVITGVQLTDENDAVYLYGSEGYVLSMSNPLTLGDENNAAELIGKKIVGLRFRPFSGDHIAYPLAEFMDLAYIVDRKDRVYRTVLTDIGFNYFGFTTLKCSADSPIRNSSKYYGSEVKAIVEARKAAKEQISFYDKTVQEITQLISQGFGMYITSVIQEDGSKKYYLHDKPTISESSYVCYLTSEGIVASTDGGTSWAIDKNGNALFNVLSVVGFYFDWAKGGTITLGGENNTGGILNVYDEFNHHTFQVSQSGISSYFGSENPQIYMQISDGIIKFYDGGENLELSMGNTQVFPKNYGQIISETTDYKSLYLTTAIFMRHLKDNHPCLFSFAEAVQRPINKLEEEMVDVPEMRLSYNIEEDEGVEIGIGWNMGEAVHMRRYPIDFGKNISLRASGDSIEGDLRLEINGTEYIRIYQHAIEISSFLDNVIYCDNDINMRGNDIVAQSDERFKKNILASNISALDTINTIQTFEYDWVKSDKHERLGFIAQQLESENPDFSYTDKNTGEKGIRPLKIIPYLVKSIQELSEQVEGLKKQVAELKGETYIEKRITRNWKPSYTDAEKMDYINNLQKKEARHGNTD